LAGITLLALLVVGLLLKLCFSRFPGKRESSQMPLTTTTSDQVVRTKEQVYQQVYSYFLFVWALGLWIAQWGWWVGFVKWRGEGSVYSVKSSRVQELY